MKLFKQNLNQPVHPMFGAGWFIGSVTLIRAPAWIPVGRCL